VYHKAYKFDKQLEKYMFLRSTKADVSKTLVVVAILIGFPSLTFGQPQGVPLRDQNLVFIAEDSTNIFSLVKTSVKPYQDSKDIFTFDLVRDYKVANKERPGDVGLNEYYMVWCNQDRIGAPMIRHLRADGMIGMIDPINFAAAITNPESGTYQRKVLDYVCKSRLGDNFKPSSTSQVKPPSSTSTSSTSGENSLNKGADQNLGTLANTPVQTDIGKLEVTYEPDADAYYPTFSKRSGEQGAVVLQLIIDETGNIQDIKILRSSSFRRLDLAATEIGKHYRFKPFYVNGKAVKISTNLLIRFYLKDAEITPEKAKEILKNEPNNVDALNALGYDYANKNEKLPEAYEMLKKAHELSPSNSNVLDSLGWVNFRLGKNELAIEQLEKAFSAAPSADKAAHIGEVYWKVGKFSEAENAWGRGEKIDPKNQVLQETLKRLKGNSYKLAPVTPALASPSNAEKKIGPNRKDSTNEKVAPNSKMDGLDKKTETSKINDSDKLIVIFEPRSKDYYSEISKKLGEQGQAIVKLTINEQGVVEDVILVSSSGFSRLDKSAVEMGRYFKFKPYIANGVPVKIQTQYSINFNSVNK
jgi:TonB family protein